MLNDVMMRDNMTSGAKANVYLEAGRTITVTGDLNASGSGHDSPAAGRVAGGISTEAGAGEIKIAAPLAGERCGYVPKPLRIISLQIGSESRRHRSVCIGGNKELSGAGAREMIKMQSSNRQPSDRFCVVRIRAEQAVLSPASPDSANLKRVPGESRWTHYAGGRISRI